MNVALICRGCGEPMGMIVVDSTTSYEDAYCNKCYTKEQ